MRKARITDEAHQRLFPLFGRIFTESCRPSYSNRKAIQIKSTKITKEINRLPVGTKIVSNVGGPDPVLLAEVTGHNTQELYEEVKNHRLKGTLFYGFKSDKRLKAHLAHPHAVNREAMARQANK